ncbi:MAG: hypothetical protein Ct9H300mP12_02360 [Acidimicrobiales bacterium]|nr:MAG: hypothetical protein Ct9H300mP12_02360 [Acidimicrobiales bacterium]
MPTEGRIDEQATGPARNRPSLRGASGWAHTPGHGQTIRDGPPPLAEGDRRNVADRYRYWTVDAFVKGPGGRRHPFHVAIENWEHDLNIGTVVRNANAFLAAGVHVGGRRRWNRRGHGYRPVPAPVPPRHG